MAEDLERIPWHSTPMKQVLLGLSAACVWGLSPAPPEARAERFQDAPAQCYRITGEAMFVVDGYNHVVTVTNGCGATLECAVWTSVDPLPKIAVTVEPGQSQSVTARRGSPVGSFTAYGDCTP